MDSPGCCTKPGGCWISISASSRNEVAAERSLINACSIKDNWKQQTADDRAAPTYAQKTHLRITSNPQDTKNSKKQLTQDRLSALTYNNATSKPNNQKAADRHPTCIIA